MMHTDTNSNQLKISGKIFRSRLILGTGRYRNQKDAIESIEISGASIITAAIRRTYFKNNKMEGLFSSLNWKKLWLLPNTAGSTNVEEAIRIARIGREISKRIGQEENNFIKLEVIPDAQYLLPDPIGTLKAAEYLTKKNFSVLAYTNTDPILAKQLEEVGCAAIMPLGSPIGSGQGLQDPFSLSIIIKNSKVPVIIDAGIGTASEASYAMELGAEGVLMNTAIARSTSPQIMAYAMKLAVKAGRNAQIAGRIKKVAMANPSSPIKSISK